MDRHAPRASLRVFLPVPKAALVAAGVPSLVRTLAALRGLSPDAVLLWGDGLRLLRPWRAQFAGLKISACLDGVPPHGFVDGCSGLMAVSPDGFAEAGALARLRDRAAAEKRPVRWVHDGKTVAACYPPGTDWSGRRPETILDPPDSGVFDPGGSAWWPTGSSAEVHRAEAALYARLPQPNDGYIAQFDRGISIPISKLLVRTPVTPNQITTAALVLGLLGAWLIGTGEHLRQVLGSLILWFCVILDGCDGEVARLKLMTSPGGGRYDVIVDNVVHVALFLGIAAAMKREDPAASVLLPLAILLAGFAAVGFTVWWLVLRRPKEERGPAEILVDKLSSRDFIYLIVVLAAVRKLGWFLWAAAIGTHVVNAAFWWLCRPARRSA